MNHPDRLQTPIYILSLASSLDRRIAISARLKSLGLTFRFFDAVDMRGVGASVIPQLIETGMVGEGAELVLSAPEIGCAMGHRMIYEAIVADSQHFAIILEDDVTLDHRFELFAKQELPVTAEFDSVVILGGQEGLVGEYHQFFRRKNQVVFNCFRIRYSFMSDDRIKRACGYLISRKTAARLLHATSPITFAADDWFKLKKAGGFSELGVLSPSVVMHPRDIRFQSTLEKFRNRHAPKNVKTGAYYWVRLQLGDLFRSVMSRFY